MPSTIRQEKVTTLVRAIKADAHADFLSASGHRDHVQAAEAAFRKRRVIEGNCTTAEIQAAYAHARELGYLP